jgi:hypothetical protein
MERRLNTNRRSILWQRPRHRLQGEADAYESTIGSAAGQASSSSQDEQVSDAPPIAAVVLRNTHHHNSFSTATTTKTSTMFSSTGTAHQAGTILPTAAVARNSSYSSNDNNSRSHSTSSQLLPPSRRVDHGDDSPVNSPVHQRKRIAVSTTASAAFAASPLSAVTTTPAPADGIVVSRLVDHGDDTPVNSPVHQRPRLTVSKTASPAAGITVSRLPSRRQLMRRVESSNSHSTGAEFDSWTNTSHTSRNKTNMAASFSAAFVSAAVAPTTTSPAAAAKATSILVSRLPSRRQLLTRAESCNSHSTGAEFDSWLNRSQTSRNTSVNTSFDTSYNTSNKSYESAASSCCTSSSIPAAPHLLRLTTQSSARNMMMMMSNSSRSMMSTNSGRSLSSSGTGTSSVPKKRRQRRRGRRPKRNNSSNGGGGNRRPTNPMALELREQMSGLSLVTTTINNTGTPGSTSPMTIATAGTTMTTTIPMMDVDDKGKAIVVRERRKEKNFNSYDSGDSSCQRLLAKCEMTHLMHRKSMSSSGDGGSISSLPSMSTIAASVSPQRKHHQQHQHQNVNATNTNHNHIHSPWQPGAHHFSAFQRRTSM